MGGSNVALVSDKALWERDSASLHKDARILGDADGGEQSKPIHGTAT